MKRRVSEILACALFLTMALSIYIFLLPEGTAALELNPAEDSQYAYSGSGDVETVGEGIEVISVPKSAERGEKISVNFKGAPSTEYQIRVYYSSGLSESKTFLPTVSDEEGGFSWEWKISSNAKAGDIRIIVTGADCRVSFTIEII